MRSPVFYILFIINVGCFGQKQTIVDLRDGNSYRTVIINGTTWISDNLEIATALSKPLTQAQDKMYNLGNVSGRYYHFQELDSVCLSGWTLPTVQNWVDYFQYLKDSRYPSTDLEITTVEKPYHHYIKGYEGIIDLFAKGNPLNLVPIGRYEGNQISMSQDTPFADYWTIDVLADPPGKTHAHLMNPWTTIHSHSHHMKVWQKKKIRRFMVRCVKESN